MCLVMAPGITGAIIGRSAGQQVLVRSYPILGVATALVGTRTRDPELCACYMYPGHRLAGMMSP